MTVRTTLRFRPIATPRRIGFVLVLAAAVIPSLSAADDVARYFTQLRQRGLFVVAEHYALSRLQDPKLDDGRRIDIVVELSRTFADHATYAGPRQRDELWQKALQVVQEELGRTPPRLELLRAQEAFVAAARVRGLRWELTVAPEDRPLRERFQQSAASAIQLLERQAGSLEEALKQGRRSDTELAPHEMRQLLSAVRTELGEVFRDRAALATAQSAQRASDLVEAAKAFSQGLSGANNVRVEARCRLGLADCSRLQRDFPKARETCAIIAGSDPALPADLLDAVDACRVRCWLDEQKPLEGAEYLLGIRQSRHVLSGELWFVQLETLLELRDVATTRQDQTLSANLQAEAELALTRVAEQAGGSWARFCRLLWERDRTQRTYGAELNTLVRAARAEYLGGDPNSSAAAYAAAISAAAAAGQVDLRNELSFTRGSILLEIEDFEAAATEFQELSAQKPSHDRAASAHLLAAYAIGRLYDQQRTQARRVAYTTALEAHLERFPADVTAGDAQFMLAQLEEHRLQYSKALPHYLAVPSNHSRFSAATIGAARCYESLIHRLESLQRDSESFHSAAIAELTRRYEFFAGNVTNWTATQGGISLSLARLHLTNQSPNYASAASILDKYLDARRQVDESQANAWRTFDDEFLPLRLVALAGTGQSLAARELIASPVTAQPASLFAVVRGLNLLAQGPATAQFVDLAKLLEAAVNRLEPQRERLTGTEQTEFDLARIRACLINARTQEGLMIVNQVAAQFPNDAAQQRELALIVSRFREPATIATALKLWRRVESLEKQGSSDWLSARISIIDLLMTSGEMAEAARLLAITRLLYPNPSDPVIRDQLADLQQRLGSKP